MVRLARLFGRSTEESSFQGQHGVCVLSGQQRCPGVLSSGCRYIGRHYPATSHLGTQSTEWTSFNNGRYLHFYTSGTHPGNAVIDVGALFCPGIPGA